MHFFLGAPLDGAVVVVRSTAEGWDSPAERDPIELGAIVSTVGAPHLRHHHQRAPSARCCPHRTAPHQPPDQGKDPVMQANRICQLWLEE
jgi:hypothetical protein